MDEEWQPDAVLDIRIAQVKKELSEYVEKNADKIDSNLPVFYGHVMSIIENSFRGISDEAHDRLIDDVTMKVLEVSKRSGEIEYVERLFSHAVRMRKRQTGRMIFDIILGFKLIDLGKYNQATEVLTKYRTTDAIICTAISYCNYALSEEHLSEGGIPAPNRRPSEKALAAREQMIELIRLHPPVNRLKFPHVLQELKINKIFWFMLRLAVDWFPTEVEFLKLGLEKAKKDGNKDMRGELLKIASERYFSDMFFLRDLYHFKIESRDASGATAVVRQMMQQHPDELEPVYYGMQLSIISSQNSAYSSFRKMAVSKKMPSNVLALLDFEFELVAGKKTETYACLEEIRNRVLSKSHYLIMIEYATEDAFSDVEKRAKAARKALLDSLDLYCMKILKMKTD
jgi:hypothetical protein